MTLNTSLKLLALSVASASVLTACFGDSNSSLTRIATVPMGAEVTGLYKTAAGDMFFNVQHPADSLPAPENNAALGVWTGLNFNKLPRLEDAPVPAEGSILQQTTNVTAGAYQVLGRAGDQFGGALPFGLGAIVSADGSKAVKSTQNPDFNAFIPTKTDGSSGYLFSAWEDRPGAVSRLEVNKLADESWQVTNAMNVDFSSVKGTMINCFGTVSPWGTPLTSEENYEAENTINWNNPSYTSGYPNYSDVKLIQEYLGGEFPNPYTMGYIVEITEPTAENPVPVKHFTMGRYAHENAVIMPDEKTVYLTDDGTDKGFYKFVADNAGDMSSGTLYAAKVTQDAEKDSAKAGFDLSWIALGTASNESIAGWIAEYDGIDESNYVEGQTSYISEAEIAEWAAGNSDKDDRYAFLETLRAAKAKGATTEFRKMEGININYEGLKSGKIPFMYVAMSEVRKGMSDDEGDIQVTENRCGIVYSIRLGADYNATRMEPFVIGAKYDAEAAKNQCDVEGMSNPDNILVLDDGRLVIGEDTSKHVNNMIWLHDAQKK